MYQQDSMNKFRTHFNRFATEENRREHGSFRGLPLHCYVWWTCQCWISRNMSKSIAGWRLQQRLQLAWFGMYRGQSCLAEILYCIPLIAVCSCHTDSVHFRLACLVLLEAAHWVWIGRCQLVFPDSGLVTFRFIVYFPKSLDVYFPPPPLFHSIVFTQLSQC